MRLKKYSSEGIVLARINLFEADRIVILYTRDYGKIPYIARGVRKPESKKRGALEIFDCVKFSAAKGKHFDVLLEAELINNYSKIRSDLKKVTVAYFLVETVGRITKEEEQNLALYEYLIKTLNNLGKRRDLKVFRYKFIYDVLVLLGFWPKGEKIPSPDKLLNQVLEKEPNSYRVGKKILS